MRKKYTKPALIKVELNHEQAVLGACSAGAASNRQGSPNRCKSNCKRAAGGGNQEASS